MRILVQIPTDRKCLPWLCEPVIPALGSGDRRCKRHSSEWEVSWQPGAKEHNQVTPHNKPHTTEQTERRGWLLLLGREQAGRLT